MVDFYTIHVGKYTIPMDPKGYSHVAMRESVTSAADDPTG